MNQSIFKLVIAVSLWIGGSFSLCLAQSPKEIANGIGMKLVMIPKGTFKMGSPESEEGRLSEEKQAGRVYRLPTESEWEYACRAGSKTAYSFDDEKGLLPEYGWFIRNSSQRTHTVGLLEPNRWGLYDMHGNVWEWCSDWYGDYPKGAVTDPVGSNMGSYRVYRGGSWFFAAVFCRSADRGWIQPSDRNFNFGFRVALSPSVTQ